MPPKQTSIGILAAGIAALKPISSIRISPIRKTLEAVADEMPFTSRLVMKNSGCLNPWLWPLWAMTGYGGHADDNRGDEIAGGVKANVLPIDATAKVNFRILPGETPDTVLERVVAVIDDPRVEVTFDGSGQRGMAPSPVSPLEGFGWNHLTTAIRDTAAPERIIIAPRLLVAATDTRHYRKITPNHYRFTYMQLPGSDLGSIHGTNERISVETLNDTVRFYFRMMTSL